MLKNNPNLYFIFILCISLSGCRASMDSVNDLTYEPDFRHTISVTIDDLPTVAAVSLEDRQSITKNLLEKVTRFEIPVVGFVNEIKLGNPVPDPQEIALLEAWLEAGLELANHTWSHMDFSANSLEDFKKDVLRGETVTRQLMKNYDMQLRWFRHPYLRTGDDPEKTKALEEFLYEHGYAIAPVTIDNWDWWFNGAYNDAWQAGDKELMTRIADDYIFYMAEVFDYVEQFTYDVLGSGLPQILLLHANRLNADNFDRVAELILERGYEFVTLEEALEGQHYFTRDGLMETSVTTWLQRLWVDQGNEPRNRPSRPLWLEQLRDSSD